MDFIITVAFTSPKDLQFITLVLLKGRHRPPLYPPPFFPHRKITHCFLFSREKTVLTFFGNIYYIETLATNRNDFKKSTDVLLD